MGGFGSGLHSHSGRTKSTVEQSLTLSISDWTREGLLQKGARKQGAQRWTDRKGDLFTVDLDVDARDADQATVTLSYSYIIVSSDVEQSEEYQVDLTTTRPNFGGLRWWFICPLSEHNFPCQRRVTKLHLPPSARYFGCRHCHNLTYRSCRESRKYDAAFKELACLFGQSPTAIQKLLRNR